jgi:hypothetical protein
MRAYTSTTGKNIFKTLKNVKQKFSIYALPILYARGKFCGNPNFFVPYVKKTKNLSCNAYFSTKKKIYTQHKNIVFSWNNFVRT